MYFFLQRLAGRPIFERLAPVNEQHRDFGAEFLLGLRVAIDIDFLKRQRRVRSDFTNNEFHLVAQTAIFACVDDEFRFH